MNDGENEDIFDEKRQRLYNALIQHNTTVAGSYKAAIRAFKSPAPLGEERARVSNICNLMREVMRTLPSVMGDISEKTPKELNTNELIRNLPERLSTFTDLDLRQDQDYIPVPKGAAAIFSDLVAAASQDKKSVRENAAILIGESSVSNHPASKQWAETNEFFAKGTHLGDPPVEVDASMSDDEIEKNILVVEDLLEIRVNRFFDSLHAVKSLLDDINQQGDGDG